MKKITLVKKCVTCGGETNYLLKSEICVCVHCGYTENTCVCNPKEIAKLMGMGID